MIPELLYYLVPALVNLGIGVWILSKRPRMATNIWFFLCTFIFLAWGVGDGLRQVVTTSGEALAIDRVTAVAGLALPLFAYFFLLSLRAEIDRGKTVRPSAAIVAVLAGGSLALMVFVAVTNLVLEGTVLVGSTHVITPGPLYVVFGAWIVGWILLLFIPLLIKGLGEKRELVRRQYLVIGLSPLLTALAFVSIDMVPSLLGASLKLSSYPATILFTLILGLASHRLGLMAITPEGAARQALEAQPDGVVLIDQEGEIRFANGSFARLLGLKSGAEVGGKLQPIWTVFSKGYERLLSRPWEELPDQLDLRGELSTGSSESVPVVCTFRKWIDALGETPGAIVQFRDERPIRKLEGEMIHVEKLHSLGTMVSGIAHELNNPLTSIIGFSEMGKKKDMGPDRYRSFFESINSEAQRAHRVIQSLLEFARTSFDVECTLSINQILKDIMGVRRFELEARGVDLAEDLDAELPDTKGDPRKLRQIFLNVFNNAGDAAEEARARGRVRIQTRVEEGHFVIRVSDNGPGIPDKVLPRVFDPFFTTKTVGMGTGLGLSISHSLVTEMGGRILVDTKAGEGTTFTVAIPVTAAEPEALKPPSTASFREKLEQKPRILIIDDEDVLVEMMSNFLKFKGCEVDRAPDGLVGLEKIRNEIYDIILCDIKMPNLNGREMVKILGEEDPDKLKKLVICSGDTVSPETQSFISHTGLRTLNKPFTLKELAKTLKKVLAETYYIVK
jgi:PAS domain S-box-containing protein